jgi:tRNA (cmo5U34)-methyltransferase
VKDDTVVYDLGCSLGAVSLSIRHAIGARSARIIAVDNSEAMVKKAREVLSADSGLCPVEVCQGDITAMNYEKASLIVLNFTLQFAPPEQRAQLLGTLADSLVPGGALVLSEKTEISQEGSEKLYREMHDAFRESNGYSQMEISRKREALERVLIPERPERYEQLLKEAGLVPLQWFRCLHFVSWVARKEE